MNPVDVKSIRREQKRWNNSSYTYTIDAEKYQERWDKERDMWNNRMDSGYMYKVYPIGSLDCSCYSEMKLPKKTGGFRVIHAPSHFTKRKLVDIRSNIINRMMDKTANTHAYAYVKKRSPKDALEVHRFNKSRWFLKLDLTKFFDNITWVEFYAKLRMIYPYEKFLNQRTQNSEYVKEALKACFALDEETQVRILYQGSPASPVLSNIFMIPFDYELSKKLREKGFVYTRYCDDILISHRNSFDMHEIEDMVMDTFNELGYTTMKLNRQKSRYGSINGHNFNLGLILNKDNNITIGNDKKKEFKAMLTRYCHNELTIQEEKRLKGLYAYYKGIEEEYIEYVVKKYSEKFGVRYLKETLTGKYIEK